MMLIPMNKGDCSATFIMSFIYELVIIIANEETFVFLVLQNSLCYINNDVLSSFILTSLTLH